MPLSAPNSLATLTGQRDRLARLGNQATYAGAADTAFQATIDDALSDALDRLAGDFSGGKTWEREGAFNTKVKRTGTDGVVTISDATFTSAAATFTPWGGAKREAGRVGAVDGVLRVLSGTTETAREFSQDYAAATATAKAFTICRDEYALDNGAWWIRRVWNRATARPIALVTFEDYIARTGELFRAGEPELCAVVAPMGTEAATTVKTRLRLFPFPDTAQELAYTYTSVPTFPTGDFETAPHLQHLLAAAAAAEFLRLTGEDERALAFEASYERLRRAAVARDNTRGDARIVLGSNRALLPGGGGLWGIPRDPRTIDAP